MKGSRSRVSKDLIKEIENFIRFEGRDANYIGEGLHYPVYGGKYSSVLRNGCEVLKKKNNQILKSAKFYK